MAETNREGRTAYAAARHLIVDIETLGLTVPAPVLSIGAVFWIVLRGFRLRCGRGK